MRNPVQITNTAAPVRHALNRSPWQRAFLILFVTNLAISVLPTVARAVCVENCSGTNTGVGAGALFNVTTGIQNAALGIDALYANTTGSNNTAGGTNAMQFNTAGNDNTSFGAFALDLNPTGSSNTAIGRSALYANSGDDNTATGAFALSSNQTGNYNTADGFGALFNNTTGGNNAATGWNALYSNTTGTSMTAMGANTLYYNTTGTQNTATGGAALNFNSTGSNNTADGVNALFNNMTGSNNTADGHNALQNSTGGSNIALGESAGINLTTGSNNIDIGNKGVANESNTIRLGKKGTQTASYIAGISGTTVAGGVGVLIDTNGRLGTVVSSERCKDSIKPMDKASEAILALKPVTFRYKHELDPDGIPQFGLVAEQVETVNPDLVARDDQGRPYSVRYEAVNAMLLNEFLKEHRKVEHLETIVARQQKDFASAIAQQTEDIRTLTSKIQKVSEQLEMSKPAPRVVVNNQ